MHLTTAIMNMGRKFLGHFVFSGNGCLIMC